MPPAAQYMMNPSLPAALYGFPQPNVYSPYSGGLEDLAALQRSAAGLHTLVGSAAAPHLQQQQKSSGVPAVRETETQNFAF